MTYFLGRYESCTEGHPLSLSRSFCFTDKLYLTFLFIGGPELYGLLGLYKSSWFCWLGERRLIWISFGLLLLVLATYNDLLFVVEMEDFLEKSRFVWGLEDIRDGSGG